MPEKISKSKSLKSLKEFIKGQSDNAIVPQRKINPDQLKKKIDQFSTLQDLKNKDQIAEAEKAGLKLSKKSSVLDGAVNITGQATIQSLKKFLNEQNLRVKTKAERNQETHSLAAQVKLPVPSRPPSMYVPQNTFKYQPFLSVRKKGEPVKPKPVTR